MLRELQLDGTIYDKTAIAIERIKTMSPIAESIYGEYTVMVSGGKDSSVITDLAIRSGAKIKFATSWTGLERPETVRFLRRERERLRSMGYSFEFIIPRDRDGKQITMWKLIEKKGFPTRMRRFCCEALKENTAGECYCILGVRWEESPRRKSTRYLHEQVGSSIAKRKILTNDNGEARRLMEVCVKKNKYILNPIIDWSAEDVWEYIRERGLPYNPLYDMGHTRVGCIGCPMRKNKKELEELPRWAALYKRAGEKYLEKSLKKGGFLYQKDIEGFYNWWVNLNEGHTVTEEYREYYQRSLPEYGKETEKQRR